MPELEDLRLVRCGCDEEERYALAVLCLDCDGTVLEIIETVPIEQDDLDIMCGSEH